LNGVNFGVARCPAETATKVAAEGSSTKGLNDISADVFGGGAFAAVVVFVLEEGPAGGGISPNSESQYTAIFEPEEDAEVEAEVTRLLFPACFSMVFAIFFTSGTFSLTLDFRVPISCQESEEFSIWESVPEGSTNIWSRELEEVVDIGSGVDTLRDVDDDEVRVEEVEGLREVVVRAGRGFCEEVVVVVGAGGSIMLLIIRFWKSLYRS
jgi:hypothetical protein